jgi:glycosyltransferase involved in cell wall biosynthesis
MPSALFITTVNITLEAFLLPFADHLRAQGWRIDAAANGATSNERIADHFGERFDVAWSRNPLSPRNLVGTSRRVRDIVSRGDYDVVWVHTPIAAWVTRFALRKMRRRAGRPVVVYTAHGFHFYPVQKPLPHAVFRTMERIAARWTDFLVTINRADFEAARAFRGIAPERVRYIPGIGVDCTRFSPDAADAPERDAIRAELNLAPEDVAIVMVAELSAVKRHEFALDALSKVQDPRARLVLVGAGPDEEKVRARVTGLGLDERVRFTGFRRDVPALLASCDALLLCSEREGLARSVLEGMASGLPVFGTDTRGIADALDEDSGWIAPKDDPAALATAIDGALADPSALKRRGQAARARACAEFGIEAIVAAYDTLWDEALKPRPIG